MEYVAKFLMTRAARAGALAAAVLIFTAAVSCGKKEAEAPAPAPASTDQTAAPVVEISVVTEASEQDTAESAPREENVEAVEMEVVIEVPPVVEEAVSTRQPSKQPAARQPSVRHTPPPSPPPPPTPPPPPPPTPPSPPPSAPPPPRITVESISGPKNVTVGRSFALTGNIVTDGEGKPEKFSWRFKSGDKVIERTTEKPRIEITLDKVGEWTVTCGVMWNGKSISSMTIRINVVAPPVQEEGRIPFFNNDIDMAGQSVTPPSSIHSSHSYVMPDVVLMMLARNDTRSSSSNQSDIVSDAVPMMLAYNDTTSSPPSTPPSNLSAPSDPIDDAAPVTPADKSTKSLPVAEGSTIEIKGVTGPAQIVAGVPFVLTLDFGAEPPPAVTAYVWRFTNADGEVLEARTEEPQATMTFQKTGAYVVTCDIVTDAGTFAAKQRFTLTAVSGQTAISAGGPYEAMMTRPVKVLGNALSNASEIVKYEWFFETDGETPEWSAAENAVVEHTFARSGEFKVVYRVTLADGSTAADTAVINVGSMMPSANAGADVLSYPGRKVKLRGTGRSPDGRIVNYEWDFDGNGMFDWSSAKDGNVSRRFNTYSFPIFRVTDTEGNTAQDTMRVIICPKDMVTVESGKFCVDKYEWPNCRNSMPIVNVTKQEAAAACDKVGKRLCSEDEWRRACRDGRSARTATQGTFPYGEEFDETRCNTLNNPRWHNTLHRAGTFRNCRGHAVRAFDMSGNAAEWVTSDDDAAAALGGFYQSDADGSNCDSRVVLEDDTKYLYVGFRCCK